jgi:hypothetical protein
MIQVSPDGGFPCIPIVGLSGCSITPLGGDLARSAAGAAADGLMGAFASYVSAADSWLIGHVVGLFDATPNVGAEWFRVAYRATAKAFEAVVTPILLVATIGSIVRQDLRRLGRVWAVGLPVAVLAAAAATVLTELAIRATDSLTSMVVGAHLNVHGALQNLADDAFATGSPALVGIGIGLLALAGAVLVWLELVLRSAAIYVAVFFMPLCLVTYIWPATAAIAKRSVQILIALVLSKFVIFTTLWLGMSTVAGDRSIDGALEGAGILLLASFAPFVLLRLVPIAEVDVVAHLEGVARRPFRAASRAAAAVAAPTNPLVMRLLAARTTSETAQPQTSPVTAQPLAVRAPDYRIPAGGSDG